MSIAAGCASSSEVQSGVVSCGGASECPARVRFLVLPMPEQCPTVVTNVQGVVLVPSAHRAGSVFLESGVRELQGASVLEI